MSDVTITLSQADIGLLLGAIAARRDQLRDGIALFTDGQGDGDILPYLQRPDIRNHVAKQRAALDELHALHDRLIRVWHPEPVESGPVGGISARDVGHG